MDDGCVPRSAMYHTVHVNVANEEFRRIDELRGEQDLEVWLARAIVDACMPLDRDRLLINELVREELVTMQLRLTSANDDEGEQKWIRSRIDRLEALLARNEVDDRMRTERYGFGPRTAGVGGAGA